MAAARTDDNVMMIRLSDRISTYWTKRAYSPAPIPLISGRGGDGGGSGGGRYVAD